MARNSIGYEGRIVNTEKMPAEFGKIGSMTLLKLVIAEQHSMKNGKAPKRFQDENKGAEDYVDTFTSWHKLTVFGDKAEEYAQDPNINHGAIVQVEDASYTEEDPWTTRDGVQRAGRPETIGENAGSLTVKAKNNGELLGPKEPRAIWDGESAIPSLGGGGRKEREYGDDEGF